MEWLFFFAGFCVTIILTAVIIQFAKSPPDHERYHEDIMDVWRENLQNQRDIVEALRQLVANR